MVLVVGGMHRSGTSLLAKLLNTAGMYLGPEDCLMPPAQDNPEGFYENLDFVRLNDRLLAHWGGAWDFVPEMPPDWAQDQALETFREEAKKLIQSFEEHEFWGWKDPRNSLTFDFWKSLLPQVRFILVLRHPLEVARSLHKRNFFSLINGLNLWVDYNQKWAEGKNDNEVLITHYDAFLSDPAGETQRILQWCGMECKNDLLEKLSNAVKPELRHQRKRDWKDVPEKIAKPVQELYERLCEKAGFDAHSEPSVTVAPAPAKEEPDVEEVHNVEVCPDPIFVVGCYRSGTSVLAHSIGKHSHTWIGEESNFMTVLANVTKKAYALGTQRGAYHWLSSQNVSYEEFMYFLGLGVNALYTSRANGKRWIEQTPEYTLNLFELGLMFPGASFVNIIRDGRAVVHSMINSGFKTDWANNFEKVCKTWVLFVKAGLEFESRFSKQAQRVYLELLKKEPEAQFKTLAQNLHLPYETALTEMFAQGKTINSSFKSGKRKEWFEAWDSNQRKIFNRIAGPLLIALGYASDDAWVNGKVEATEDLTPAVDRRAEEILNDWQKDQKTKVFVSKPVEQKSQHGKAPKVSIIIPLYNQLEFTHRCLKAILKNTKYPNYEVVFVDNASTDDTGAYLKQLNVPNVKAVFNEQNLGYVGGCNAGARAASGDFLLFLNNDTEVQPGWLENLVALATEREDCGAVGCKLVYPDGRLQEAGAIVFSDGNGWNYGRGFHPDDPRFNFVREVDYCSGAALMVRSDLFNKLGGFDERYMPAYYEDTDLCFGIRKLGFKVYYQPKSVVIHYEGQTAGTDLASGFKKYQQINKQKFVEKWREELKKQFRNDAQNVPLAALRGTQLRFFVADPFLPLWDRASGSLRLFNYLKILKKQGHHITFLARVGSTDPKYKDALQQLGIEVYENDEKALKDAGLIVHKALPSIPYEIIFKERQFHYAILSFWHLARYYMGVVRKYSPKTRIIIDTVDIHFVRELREAQLKKDRLAESKARQTMKEELEVYRKADRLWVVTEEDKKHIEDRVGDVPIDIVPNIHEPVDVSRSFDETSDLLFVGNFAHPPNADAVMYFVQEIFPRVKKELPGVKFYVVGNNPTPQIVALNGKNDVVVTGFVPDLVPYLMRTRVSVSPLRYGAGMKGKIGQALSYGLPVVTTSVGAEGMKLKDGEHVLIADDPRTFARKVVELYKNSKLWKRLSRQGKKHIEGLLGPGAVENTLRLIFEKDLQTRKLRYPDVSIIMLTYNALEYTKKCVDSVLQHTDLPYELIMVDNGSSDGTVEYLKELQEKHAQVKVIFNKQNKGFARGNNQGARKARGKYLLFMNNDLLVSEGWLEDLVAGIEKDNKIGMIGPITNSISGLQRVENVPYREENGFHEFARKVREVNRGKITPRRRIAGFCLLMPRTLFNEIGGFDKRFGSGNFEDDDLCIRVRQRKYAIMVHEGVFVHHYGSQTFKANNIRYEESIQEKAKIFFRKYPKIDYEELLELKNPLSQVHANLKDQIQQNLQNGEWSKARQLSEEILYDNPLDLEARFSLGLSCFFLKDYDFALENAKYILFEEPGNAAALNLMGQILMAEGRLEEAEKAFFEAKHNNPQFVDAWRNYAHVLIEKGAFDDGVKQLKEILQKFPQDVPTLLYFAQLNLEAERFEQAAEMVEQALSIEPQNQLALQLKQLLEEQIQPGQEQDRVQQALAALEKGNARQALDSLKVALQQEPDNLEAQYGMALALQMLEDWKGAEQQLKAIVEREPQFTLALNDLARLSFMENNLQAALDYFNRSLEVDPQQPAVRNQVGEVLIEMGKFQEGVEYLTETLKMFPSDVETVKHLARLFKEAGNETMSRKLYERALVLQPGDAEAQENLKATTV